MATRSRTTRTPGNAWTIGHTANVLRRVPYFDALPATDLRWLAGRCKPLDFPGGAFVFVEGEPCSGLFIIAKGRVEIRQESSRGRGQVLHAEDAGATLGEVPLFDRGGYLASAVTLEPTRLLFLPRPDVVAVCQRRPIVALKMLEAMAGRVRRFAGLLGDLAFRPVIERLARYLVAAAQGSGRATAHGTEIHFRLTQEQLAARLGTVREPVSRALAQLERDGIIARARGRVVVRDPGRLTAIAHGEG